MTAPRNQRPLQGAWAMHAPGELLRDLPRRPPGTSVNVRNGDTEVAA